MENVEIINENIETPKVKKTRVTKKVVKTRAEVNKAYRERNSDKLKQKQCEKIKCEICDCDIARAHIALHNKTKKHQNNLTKTV